MEWYRKVIPVTFIVIAIIKTMKVTGITFLYHSMS